MTRRRTGRLRLPKSVEKLANHAFKSQLLTIFLALFILGYWVGTRVNERSRGSAADELFDHLAVVSYRESPSDSSRHFVAELSAGGRVFRQFDIDRRRFEAPIRGHEYRRSINGTRYGTLEVRGHVDRGFWLELPGGQSQEFRPDQFTELYRSTVDYLKPVSILTNLLGTLSGYSVGFRIATWSSSLGNPMVQDRLMETPGIGRRVAREAWRRVLLEPVLMDDGNDAARFAALRGTQRIYTNFYRLALHDSDGFIPREAARLDSLGRTREAGAMRAFANAARRAASDSSDLVEPGFLGHRGVGEPAGPDGRVGARCAATRGRAAYALSRHARLVRPRARAARGTPAVGRPARAGERGQHDRIHRRRTSTHRDGMPGFMAAVARRRSRSARVQRVDRAVDGRSRVGAGDPGRPLLGRRPALRTLTAYSSLLRITFAISRALWRTVRFWVAKSTPTSPKRAL